MTNVQKKYRGFALIEALVALAVVSLGSMGLAGVQMFLARNGDLAVQRTQATVIADSCLEALRAYALPEDWAGLPDRPKDASGVSVCPAGPTTIAPVGSNTSYTRQVIVGAAVSDNLKPVTVKVTWQDRASESHSLDFTTVIAKADPAAASRLTVASATTSPARNPVDRHASIPVNAISDGLLNSEKKFKSASIYFNNDDGLVCVSKKWVIDKDGKRICSGVKAFYLQGYIKEIALPLGSRGLVGGLVDVVEGLVKTVVDILGGILSLLGLGGFYDQIKEAVMALPFKVVPRIQVVDSAGKIDCEYGFDSAGLLDSVVSGVTQLAGDVVKTLSGLLKNAADNKEPMRYACIIPFKDPAGGKGYWTGESLKGEVPMQTVLVGVKKVILIKQDYLVCRYQLTNVLALEGMVGTDADNYIRNKSNHQPYKNVAYNLTDQNYLIFTGKNIPNECPLFSGADGKPDPLVASEVNTAYPPKATLVKHQRCVGSSSSNRPDEQCEDF